MEKQEDFKKLVKPNAKITLWFKTIILKFPLKKRGSVGDP